MTTISRPLDYRPIILASTHAVYIIKGFYKSPLPHPFLIIAGVETVMTQDERMNRKLRPIYKFTKVAQFSTSHKTPRFHSCSPSSFLSLCVAPRGAGIPGFCSLYTHNELSVFLEHGTGMHTEKSHTPKDSIYEVRAAPGPSFAE